MSPKRRSGIDLMEKFIFFLLPKNLRMSKPFWLNLVLKYLGQLEVGLRGMFYLGSGPETDIFEKVYLKPGIFSLAKHELPEVGTEIKFDLLTT